MIVTENLSKGAGSTALVPVETGLFGRLQAPADRPEAEIQAAAAKAAAYAVQARAENTRIAYRKGWAAYSAWCDRLGFVALGSDPEVVALYLASAADRLAVASLRLHLAAIVAAHRLIGRPLDVKDARIATVMGGIERSKGRAPKRQAVPMLPEFVKPFVQPLGPDPAALRDRAMVLLGFGAATRRSELAALDRGDIAFLPQGLTVLFRRSKTDQMGEGEKIAIHAASDGTVCPLAAMLAWLALRGDQDGPLFLRIWKGGRLSDRRISAVHVGRVLKRQARGAGLDPTKFSGHSLRAGLATSASIRGALLERIMRQTRHKSFEAARRYVRDAEIWRENVTKGVFEVLAPARARGANDVA